MSFGQQLQNSYQSFVECVPYIEKLEEMCDAYAHHVTHDGTITLESVHRLDLEHVAYTYDGDRDALVDVNVSFAIGEIVGVVGPSGSGKSTLSQLILRLRDATRGVLVVNGTPAGAFTLSSWYRRFSL